MSSKSLIRFILIGTILALAACATTTPSWVYRPSVDGGVGYFEREMSNNKWMFGSYFNSYRQTPQQAANIVMRRAAEKGMQDGYQWVRILNYDTEKRRGPIASLPALDDMEGNSIFRGLFFFGNLDAAVTESQIRRGINYAQVEYVEYSRDVNCQTEKCGTTKYIVKKCLEEDYGATEAISQMCSATPDTTNEGSQESCVDLSLFISKDFCSKIDNVVFNPRGMIEERNPRGIGAWYRVKDILQKYTEQSEKWVDVRKK